MLKRTTIWILPVAIVFLALIYWWNIPVQPSTEGVAITSGLKIDQSASVKYFKRIHDGMDPAYMTLLTSTSDLGDKFCSDNREFVVKRDQPAEIFLGKPYSDMLLPDIRCHVQVVDRTGHALGIAWKNRILVYVFKI
jgi:hypothetical protein